jgi:hypothetical protein
MNKRLFMAIKGRSLLIFGLFFLAVIAYSCIYLFAGEKIVPEHFLAQSMKRTLASKTFRYQVEVKTDSQTILSQVEGEWVSPNLIHLKGEMYNTPVEFIRTGETTYLKDIWTQKWLDLKGNRLGQAQLYVVELEPLVFLNFQNVLDVQYSGLEKSSGGKMLRLECQPQLPEIFPGGKDKEYHCKFWIDARDQRIRQVLLQPAEPAGKDLPTISLKLWAYDQAITIEPPAES